MIIGRIVGVSLGLLKGSSRPAEFYNVLDKKANAEGAEAGMLLGANGSVVLLFLP